MARHFGLVVTLCLTLGGVGAWASMPPLPTPPLGWEARVLPGFEPSLESALARGGRFTDDYARECWKQWGPEAVEGFFTLFGDPAWEKFREPILRMLFLSPHPEARGRLEQELRAEATGGSASKSTPEIYNFAGYFALYFPDTSLPLLKDLAHSPREDVRVAAGHALATLVTDESLAATREVAQGLSGDSRSSVEWNIEAVMGKKRAKEIMIK